MSRDIVLVLGMHRSGTSVVAGLLHRHGVRMGSSRVFYPRPNPENPHGFYEDVRFRLVNDRLLNSHGYRVKEWGTAVPDLTAGRLTRTAMTSLLRVTARRAGNWGWKDPRQLLTMRPWIDVLEQADLLERVRIVWVARNPDSVARSLVTRGSMTSTSQALGVVDAYLRKASEDLGPLHLPTATVTFEHLVSKPMAALAPVGDMLGIEFSTGVVDAFVDPGLNRSARAVKDA